MLVSLVYIHLYMWPCLYTYSMGMCGHSAFPLLYAVSVNENVYTCKNYI